MALNNTDKCKEDFKEYEINTGKEWRYGILHFIQKVVNLLTLKNKINCLKCNTYKFLAKTNNLNFSNERKYLFF